jgi:hypothetical protein
MAPKIQKATELKEEGNSLLTEKKEYEAALQKYSEAIDLVRASKIAIRGIAPD